MKTVRGIRMMMMMIKWAPKYFLFVLLLSRVINIQCQVENDIYSWNGLTLKKDISKFSIYLEPEIRFKNTNPAFNEGFLQGGVKYNLNNWISIAQFYRYIISNEGSYYEYENMHFTDVTISYEIDRTKLSWRSRYQITKAINSEYNTFEHINRNKFEISHNLYKSPFSPSLGYEFFISLYPEKNPYVYKNRFSAGTNIRISSAMDLSFSYYFDLSRTRNKAINNHIFVTRFSYEF